MTINTYDVGTTVKLGNQFKDATGANADPTTTVTLKYLDPTAGAWVTVNSGWDLHTLNSGYYEKWVSLTHPGTWLIRWEGVSGPIEITVDTQIIVTDSPLK